MDLYEQLGLDQMPVKAKNELLGRLTQDLYQSNRMFRPLFPWVFVRVLPREQKVGSIITPAKQNKVIEEGVVLATWQPFTRWGGKKYDDRAVPHVTYQRFRSELQPGDHVLFHHFAGVPIDGFDRDHFRVVKECNFQHDREGGIFATLTYSEDGVRASLEELLFQRICSEDDETAEATAGAVCERFLLVDREEKSVTLSGR